MKLYGSRLLLNYRTSHKSQYTATFSRDEHYFHPWTANTESIVALNFSEVVYQLNYLDFSNKESWSFNWVFDIVVPMNVG